MASDNFSSGWIKIYRSLTEKGWYKDSEYVHLWLHLLCEANHSGREWFYKGQNYKVKRGQFITSRLSLSKDTGIQESKVERILKCFESEHQIEQENKFTNRLISICNYEIYQASEQEIEQQMNSERTASEQPVNTTKEFKNLSTKENTSTSPAGDAAVEVGKSDYEKLPLKDIKNVSEFISSKNPKFDQPYVDLWNLFATKHGCSKISTMSDSRKKKLKVRLGQGTFKFVDILTAAAKQTFALKSRWFTFDFLIENDNNFVKVLEMKYLDSDNGKQASEGGTNGIELKNRVK